MKKVIVLLFISIFLSGCASIPSGPDSFDQNEIGAIHLDAESLSYEKASYLYMGIGKENLLMLSEINVENYQDAFGVKKSATAAGLYNKYLKINPGLQDLTIMSIPQGVHYGNEPSIITTINLSYEFVPGHVYVFDQTEKNKIDVLFWKIGSEESYKDEIELIEERD